jgi:hypothetical protein
MTPFPLRPPFLSLAALMVALAVAPWLRSANDSGRTAAAPESSPAPVMLPAAHREAVRQRKVRIAVQHDVHSLVAAEFPRRHPGQNLAFTRFRDAVFAYADEPGSQIDAIWWDISGILVGATYPSEVLPPVELPQLKQWLAEGTDWVTELVQESRRRKLEVFWNHRISDVDGRAEGGKEMTRLHPLKAAHPDWVTKSSFWWQGMWNLEAAGLRAHKVAIIRELATKYDFDGFQIDFSRHIPCLPVGRQWELRDHVTQFLRATREALLEVAQKRGRPILLAVKIPETLAGCRADGFDVESWAQQRLVDIMTLGSRTMDVHLEEFRAAVGPDIRLQPCFDDHHTTDGYHHAPIEYLRGVFTNHWQRGADSVVTFNWSFAPPEISHPLGMTMVPESHRRAYHEVGVLNNLARKNKAFAVERRSGYPWADGYFNRNDTAPLPAQFSVQVPEYEFNVQVGDSPQAPVQITVQCVFYGAGADDAFEVRWNGRLLKVAARDPKWQDLQIFAPLPPSKSGSNWALAGKVSPERKLLRLDFAVPVDVLRQGRNAVSVRAGAGTLSRTTHPSLEKLEAHLNYD